MKKIAASRMAILCRHVADPYRGDLGQDLPIEVPLKLRELFDASP
jgi:hypothetical protein